MSKQREAKAEQGYTKQSPNCSGCQHYSSNVSCHKRYGYESRIEKNIRCDLGGFAINKTAYCDKFIKRSVD
jgi:hypothetical protein